MSCATLLSTSTDKREEHHFSVLLLFIYPLYIIQEYSNTGIFAQSR